MKKLKLALAAAGLALASSGVNAAVINLPGATVDFSFDDSSLASSHWGTYSVTGDTLSFAPIDFEAAISQIGLNKIKELTPFITVTAKSGNMVTDIIFFENGNYELFDDASVKVGTTLWVNSSALTSNQTFTTPNNFDTTDWSVSESVALGWTESASLRASNTLTAIAGHAFGSSPFNYAIINKANLSFTAYTAPVPVPGAFWLFGSALTGVLVSRRRNITA